MARQPTKPARTTRASSASRDNDARAAASDGRVHWLTVVGARHHNLKNITVDIPLGRFTCVTGVSGSGKSSLVNDIIRERLARDLNAALHVEPGEHDAIRGTEHLDKIVDIDQSPIGRTPRSNPATYIKVFDHIRELYAQLPDAKVRGYRRGRFSFNVQSGARGGGRCEACEGNGANKIEMDFLADIWVTCAVCQGQRFNRETLQIRFKGKTIADVLDMDVADALAHFRQVPRIAAMLQTLHDVGLDYVKLGQSSTTLSGGEAQRIKLARELTKRATGRTLYILDEPTTGLHFDDIKKLLKVLHGFVDAGNTVLVIEHNLDVVKTADWIIDLGPEGGEEGGYVVAEGTPEDVTRVKASYTGQALCSVLRPGRRKDRAPRPRQSRDRGWEGRPADRRNGRRHRGRGTDQITVIGARQHNLKDVTVAIPRGRSTVFCGPSGSGKSSLALDTIYAEGRRRYVESLSAYARQFLGQLAKPRVDHVYGLSPAIAIEQKSAGTSPRSTVGTVTEIYDYMRVLWARIGRPHCPKCRAPVGAQTSDEIVDRILELGEGTRALLLAPVQRVGNESYDHLFERQRANGFTRVRIDGLVYSLDEEIGIDRRSRHEVEIVVDRLIVKASARARIGDSVEQALSLGNGVIRLHLVDEEASNRRDEQPPSHRGRLNRDGEERSEDNRPERPDASCVRAGAFDGSELRFSQRYSCGRCGESYDEPTPHHFSFNSRMGWCARCEGLGVQRGASPAAIVVHPNRSILDGALAGWEEAAHNPMQRALLRALARHVGFDPDTPWNRLAEAHRLAVLQGCGDAWIELLPERCQPVRRSTRGRTRTRQAPATCTAVPSLRFRWNGFFPAIDRATRSSWQYRKRLEELVTDVPCTACGGSRLRPESRFVEVGGVRIEDACRMPLREALAFFTGLKLSRRERKVAGELLREITSRLRFLVEVGLDYVTLNRSAPTLSGGESQRIRLASQIGSGLTGVLYVLDEPTIGLHPRDTARLIAALSKLRDLGNSLIVVEHDREVIDHADHVLDFGPGAGRDGGTIVAAAAPAKLRSRRRSLTGRYLSGAEAIPVPSNRREVVPAPTPVLPRSCLGAFDPSCLADRGDPIPERWLVVEGARHNNLREIDVAFPLGRFIAVTGVSGSGKSSLVTDTLYNALAARIHRARLVPGGHQRLVGAEHIDKVINVDQSPIGNTPSSNPATYTGVFDLVRELYAKLPDAKVRGYTANRFSFNRPGGRCEACAGNGKQRIEMHFLPDVWIECEACRGARYVRETLDIRYRGKNIADVLAMRVGDALRHFDSIPRIRRMLQTLDDVGLGYLELGQPAPTLSGGEAQRVKLAAELGRPSTGKTFYILDEPTTGLHFDDLKKLLEVLHRLVDLGNTVVCIEHNLDVIKTADHVIDLGPEPGAGGGSVVVAGTPEQVARCRRSHTGAALAPVLAAGPVQPRPIFDSAAQADIERELEGALDLGDAAATEAQMPWKTDGRRWHTVAHVDRYGKPVRWDPKVLEWFVETAAACLRAAMRGSLRTSPAESVVVDWNDRARVEVKARGTNVMWFVHVLTGGAELLEITVRVPARHFDNKTVVRRLKIKTLDEREDLPIYGQWARARLRASGREYDDVRLYLRDFADVQPKAFRSFLKDAAVACARKIRETRSDPVKGQPWKTDGRKWHLSQQSIHARHRVCWKPALLLQLIGRIRKIDPAIEFDWTGKVAVAMTCRTDARSVRGAGARGPGTRHTTRLGTIVTNQGAGLRCTLRVPKNEFTPMRIERLGASPAIQPRSGYDDVAFWIRSLKENDAAQLAEVIAAAGRRAREPESRPA